MRGCAINAKISGHAGMNVQLTAAVFWHMLRIALTDCVGKRNGRPCLLRLIPATLSIWHDIGKSLRPDDDS